MKPTMRSIVLSISVLGSVLLFAQDSLITVKVQRDTIGVGQTLRVEWTVYARTDSITLPTFAAPWKLDFGPGRGTKMKMDNGSVTHSTSLTYGLRATSPGPATLPMIQARVDGVWHSSRPVTIVVIVEPVPDEVLNPRTMVPVTGYQPILVMIYGETGYVSASDPKGSSDGRDLTSDEARALIASFQDVLRTPTDPLSGTTRITATVGKTGGSVGMDTEGGRRSFQLTDRQGRKLEHEVRKILDGD